MSSTRSKLSELKHQMLAAFQSAEWQKLADLDEICRVTIQEIVAEDPRASFEELRALLSMYHQLIKDCSIQRQQYVAQVAMLRHHQKQERAYSQAQRMALVP